VVVVTDESLHVVRGGVLVVELFNLLVGRYVRV
jgi:hypothetical protein